jgi:flap endonuclease-1
MVNDAKRLLDLMGISYVQAPSEAEAQAAYMASNGSVWAASSKDYDSLLFGTPRLVRYLTIMGKEYLPSKKTFRPLKPELIVLGELLKHHKITREQLIDIAILIGTDFNRGVKGIGPKKALKFTKTYGRLENFPGEILLKLSADHNRIREIFTEPQVTQNYRLEYGELQEDELYHFLCEERDFSRKRVETAVQRMKEFYSRKAQAELGKWMK